MHCELAVSGSFGRNFISFNFDVVFTYFRFRSVSQNYYSNFKTEGKVWRLWPCLTLFASL
jgi:hypothetical protein